MWRRSRGHASQHQGAILRPLPRDAQLVRPLDKIRKGEYQRVSGTPGGSSRAKSSTCCSNHENLTLDGSGRSKLLWPQTRRLNTAYLLKEPSPGCGFSTSLSRKFYENWKESLKWQRLSIRSRKFAGDGRPHWDGLAASFKPREQVSLGFVEGPEQQDPGHPAPGLRSANEEYLRLRS